MVEVNPHEGVSFTETISDTGEATATVGGQGCGKWNPRCGIGGGRKLTARAIRWLRPLGFTGCLIGPLYPTPVNPLRAGLQPMGDVLRLDAEGLGRPGTGVSVSGHPHSSQPHGMLKLDKSSRIHLRNCAACY
jgi:hypothetical protein